MPVTSLSWLGIFAILLAVQPDPLIDGIAHFERGEYKAAESSLELAVRKGTDSRAKAFLALARAANDQCQLAVPELQHQFSTLTDPDLLRLTGLGLEQCYLSVNRVEDAIRVLVRLKKLYPSDADVLYEMARVHMKGWNEAIHEMFQRTPGSFRVNQLSGEIFDSNGKYAEAVEQFRVAIQKNPKAIGLHFRAGRAVLMNSHSAEAISEAQREFEAELALSPTDALAEYELGQVLLIQQKIGDARTHFERAVQLDGKFPEALIALAKIKLESNQTEEAISLLERAVKVVPNSESARYSLMMAYRNAGRTDEALRQKIELEKLQKPPEGEFTEFLKKLGEQAPAK